MRGRNVATEEKGSWEKHTKGIGSKLLEKMGYSGGALGKKGGLSKPIEVVKLPEREGLGYSISVNDLTTNPFDNENDFYYSEQRKMKKAYNSVNFEENVVEIKTWKEKKQTKTIYKTADELLKNISDKQVIIDMRSEEPTVLNSSDKDKLIVDKNIRCAELRYNTNLLVDYSKVKIQDIGKKIEFKTTTLNHLKTQSSNLQKIIHSDQNKIEKLTQVNDIIQKCNQKLLNNTLTITSIITMFEFLKEQYSTEFYQYRLFELSVPMLFPPLKDVIKDWDPFQAHTSIDSLSDILLNLQSIFDGCEEFIVDGFSGDIRDKREGVYFRLIEEVILPRLNSLFINQWNPRDQFHIAITLLSELQKFFPSKLFQNFIDLILIPKLKYEVEQWSATENLSSTDNKKKKKSNLSWLFSWSTIIYIESFSGLVITLKQKVQKYLQSKLELVNLEHMNLILSFKPYLKPVEFQSLLMYTLSPKISSYFQSLKLIPDQEFDKKYLDLVLKWGELLSTKQFLDILEAFYFPQFLQTLDNLLNEKQVNLKEIKNWYIFWRSSFQTHQFLLIDRIRLHYYQSLVLISSHIKK